jgi:hypothetical protein
MKNLSRIKFVFVRSVFVVPKVMNQKINDYFSEQKLEAKVCLM